MDSVTEYQLKLSGSFCFFLILQFMTVEPRLCRDREGAYETDGKDWNTTEHNLGDNKKKKKNN